MPFEAHLPVYYNGHFLLPSDRLAVTVVTLTPSPNLKIGIAQHVTPDGEVNADTLISPIKVVIRSEELILDINRKQG